MVDRSGGQFWKSIRQSAYFDFLRFTGLRKDEANRVRWEDLNFEGGVFSLPATKTDEADAYLPLAPALIEILKKPKRVEYVRIYVCRALCTDEEEKDLFQAADVRADSDN